MYGRCRPNCSVSLADDFLSERSEIHQKLPGSGSFLLIWAFQLSRHFQGNRSGVRTRLKTRKRVQKGKNWPTRRTIPLNPFQAIRIFPNKSYLNRSLSTAGQATNELMRSHWGIPRVSGLEARTRQVVVDRHRFMIPRVTIQSELCLGVS
jgi:hypothetical protein